MWDIDTQKGKRGGWRYFQKETNVLIKGAHWQNLIQKVSKHRVANNLPMEPGFEQELLDYMCTQEGVKCENKEPIKDAPISIQGVLQFTQILGEAIIKGNKVIEKEEAEGRAAICASCPSNIEPVGCEGCGIKGVAAMLSHLVGARQTTHDNKLNSCKHCGCLNRAQVWFQLELLQRHMSDKVNDELPSHCWKKL